MAKTEGKLTDEAKTFVVQQLAMYDPPEMVARAVKDEFGITISRQGVHCYDPTKYAGRQLPKKWKDLFETTRRVHLETTAEVGISHRAVRLRRLDRMATKAEAVGNMALAAQLLEQAAKEEGNAYTNKRELSGPNGGEIPLKTKTDVSHLTPEQLRALASVRIHSDG